VAYLFFSVKRRQKEEKKRKKRMEDDILGRAIGGGEANGKIKEGGLTVLFDASKKEQYYPTNGYKKLARKLKSLCKVEVNKDDLSRDRIKDANVLVFAGARERFSSSEFAALKDFMQQGGSILFMLGEGGEQSFDTNLNSFLKE
jgi:intraflagellar transport protein 52